MAKKGYKWFLSALYGTLAVAFGFWLGVSVLNWYSDREYQSVGEGKARPVSILSSQDGESKQANRKEVIEPDRIINDNRRSGESPIAIDTLELDKTNGIDSLFLDESNDPYLLYSDSIDKTPSLEEFHFIRKDRDQLVATLSFFLPRNIRQQSQTTLQLDSFLGGQPEEPTKEDIIIIELWRSPLNFRGYKFSNNVVVLYDMTQIDALNLYYSGGNLYLSYFDIFYLISHTTQFKPLMPISPPLPKN